MKQIILFITAFLVFCSAKAQMITQFQSDSIVLRRISGEVRPYTLFTKKEVQPKFTINTSQQEILDLDYSCRVYYMSYMEDTNTNYYLIVKVSSGNVLEVNTNNNSVPKDLTEWRMIKKTVKGVEIPFTEYILDSNSCLWTNIPSDTILVINSNEELENYIICDNYPNIDFKQYSLLLVHGSTIYGSIVNLTKSLIQFSAYEYKLNIEIQLQDTADPQEWHVAIIVPKIDHPIALNVYYPHISVWKCFFEGYSQRPDVIITLTMDSLLGKCYVSTSPQDLLVSDPSRRYFFQDDEETKYCFEENKLHLCLSNSEMPGYPEVSCICDGGNYSKPFVLTMVSKDSMFLQYVGGEGPTIYVYILDYLFIKQNYNY